MFTIPVRKANTSVEIDFDSFPAESVQYVIRYGLTQLVNDSHAPLVRKSWQPKDGDLRSFEQTVIDRIDERVSNLMEGKVPGAREPSDPKKAEQRKIAKAMETADPEKVAQIHKLLGL